MVENRKRYEKVLRDQAKKQSKAAQQKTTTTARSNLQTYVANRKLQPEVY